MIKTALVQNQFRENSSLPTWLERMKAYVDAALAQNAKLVLLPELYAMDLTAKADSDKEAGKKLSALACEHAFDDLLNYFARAAADHRAFILSGSLPFKVSGGVRNRAHFFGPKGLLGYYDKQFLTPDEKIYRWKSGNKLTPMKMGQVATMPIICFDVEFPHISNKIGQHSVDLMLVPSLTSEKGFHRVHACARARAVEHHCFVAVTGVCDDSATPEYVSQPAVYAPSSELFSWDYALGKYNQEDTLYVELDFDLLRKSKKMTGYYPVKEAKSKRS
jgi:predicted amidohydrolase